MNQVTKHFGDFQVRMGGTPDKPTFVVKDVCVALGVKNSRDKTRLLKTYERGVSTVSTASGTQQMTTCTEPGLYRIIMSVQKSNPAAERFQRWVYEDVLPSIRKTGSYNARPQVTQYDMQMLALEMKKVAVEEKQLVIQERSQLMQLRGTGDDVFNLTVENRLTNILGSSSTALTVTTPVLKPLSQHLEEHGYTVAEAAHLTRILAKAVANAYRAAHRGKKPLTATMRCGGRLCQVNQYRDEDWSKIESLLPERQAETQPKITNFFN